MALLLEGRFLKWNRRNRWTVIIAGCIAAAFMVWLWGFTHQRPYEQQTETAPEPSGETAAEPEPDESDVGTESRYLPPAKEDAYVKSEKPAEKTEQKPESEPEPEPEPEPSSQKGEEKDAPAEESVPEEDSEWKRPEWPEWPDWSERQTIPRRTVTGTVGSVPRWDDR